MITEEDLKDYFSRFGAIKSAEIKRDKKKKVSKGYGFIRCCDQQTLDMIMNTKHELYGRKIDVNRAFEKEETDLCKRENHARKIFIDNLSKRITKGKKFRL